MINWLKLRITVPEYGNKIHTAWSIKEINEWVNCYPAGTQYVLNFHGVVSIHTI